MAMLRLLLDAGADAQAVANNGTTALHRAINEGHVDIARALIDAGVKVETGAGYGGTTPLLLAVKLGDIAGASMLLTAGADPRAKDSDIMLQAAAKNDDLPMVQLLLSARARLGAPDHRDADDSLGPLHTSARDGRLSIVQALVKAGFAVNTRCGFSQTSPLHDACRGTMDSPDIVRTLLDAGARIEAPSKVGKRPLHFASNSGHVETVRALLAAGANANAPSNTDTRPLHVARDVSVVRALLDAGAYPRATDDTYETPLHRAARNDDVAVVHALLEAGALASAPDMDGRTPLHTAAAEGGSASIARALVSAGADVGATDNMGYTPLHMASAVAMVRVLVELGANVEAVSATRKSCTPLLAPVEEQKVYHDAMKALLDAGADIDARCANGRRALGLCAFHGNAATAQVLLDRGADIESRANDGETALQLAVEKGHSQVVKVLLEAGAKVDATHTIPRAIKEYQFDMAIDLLEHARSGRSLVELSPYMGAKLVLLATDQLGVRRRRDICYAIALLPHNAAQGLVRNDALMRALTSDPCVAASVTACATSKEAMRTIPIKAVLARSGVELSGDTAEAHDLRQHLCALNAGAKAAVERHLRKPFTIDDVPQAFLPELQGKHVPKVSQIVAYWGSRAWSNSKSDLEATAPDTAEATAPDAAERDVATPPPKGKPRVNAVEQAATAERGDGAAVGAAPATKARLPDKLLVWQSMPRNVVAIVIELCCSLD